MWDRVGKLVTVLRKEGIAATVALARKNLLHEFRWYLDRRFDRLHGTDTSDRIELDRLQVVGDHRDAGVYYEPTSTRQFEAMMSFLAHRIDARMFTFIDYGSGKGRTLMMAAEHPFREIVGVEFSRELHDIASRNLSIYRSRTQRCQQLRCVHADATQFEPPPGDLLVYFYNPFLPAVMVEVLERLREHVQRGASRVLLLYLNPLSTAVVSESGLFVRSEEIPLPYEMSREIQRKCRVFYSWP